MLTCVSVLGEPEEDMVHLCGICRGYRGIVSSPRGGWGRFMPGVF